jgi:hypothetical protein
MSNPQAAETSVLDGDESAFDVLSGEFVVTTPDSADLKLYQPLSGLLRRVRRAFGVETVFVTQWFGNEPLARYADPYDMGCDMLEMAYGTQLLAGTPAGRARSDIEAVPVIGRDGTVHGTLCARSFASGEAEDPAHRVAALRSIAQLIANWFEESAEASISGWMTLQPEIGSSHMAALA